LETATAQTAYSTATTIAHTYAAPGLFNVTVEAIDPNNVVTTRTFKQAIYAATTSTKPTSSSTLALEPAATPRVWLVNQDNDTVSVFNGSHPGQGRRDRGRHAAAQRRGRARWTHLGQQQGRRDDQHHQPSTLAVVQTISLPRSSQPLGLARRRALARQCGEMSARRTRGCSPTRSWRVAPTLALPSVAAGAHIHASGSTAGCPRAERKPALPRAGERQAERLRRAWQRDRLHHRERARLMMLIVASPLLLTQMRPSGATATLRGRVPTAISATLAWVLPLKTLTVSLSCVDEPDARRRRGFRVQGSTSSSASSMWFAA